VIALATAKRDLAAIGDNRNIDFERRPVVDGDDAVVVDDGRHLERVGVDGERRRADGVEFLDRIVLRAADRIGPSPHR
jgi:hypothetical protein